MGNKLFSLCKRNKKNKNINILEIEEDINKISEENLSKKNLKNLSKKNKKISCNQSNLKNFS